MGRWGDGAKEEAAMRFAVVSSPYHLVPLFARPIAPSRFRRVAASPLSSNMVKPLAAPLRKLDGRVINLFSVSPERL